MEIALYMKMKKIYLLLVVVGIFADLKAVPLWTARTYYEKGMDCYRACEYAAAAKQFECASFHDDDGTVSVDSIRIMKGLAIYCKQHRDSGDICYDNRMYGDAYQHYALVYQKNKLDLECRDLMKICRSKNVKNPYAGMALMEQGYFNMGRNDGPANEQPCHMVHLESFYIDKNEVSNAEYAAFLNDNGRYDSEKHLRIRIGSANCHIRYDEDSDKYSAEPGFENYPVFGVTWYGAYDYALSVGKSLPTEAQWEYAFGDAEPSGDFYHAVGDGMPNQFGIRGMADNGREWVADSYSESAYMCADSHNPEHHEVKDFKTVRGGSSLDDDFNPKTFRDYERPGFGRGSIGFRCVKNLVSDPQ